MSVDNLMRDWFHLKDEQTAKKQAIRKFHENYKCTGMKSTEYNEYPTQCIYRSTIGKPVEDMCDQCTQRHQFYLDRMANARQRGAILNKVRHILATPLTKKGASKV